ncbi:hypothetical protein JXA40_03095 [bacterium]|nr:hypothetical protein [candidate division CSSED10-310 bacterium]
MIAESVESEILKLEYPPPVKLKFLVLIAGVVTLFILRSLFVQDPAWLVLGVISVGALSIYYRFRILRVVTVSEKGVSQRVGRREWLWQWLEIRQVSEKIWSRSNLAHGSMRRMTILHESGRDISFDTHMGPYQDAARTVTRTAKSHGVGIEVREVPFFMLVYW